MAPGPGQSPSREGALERGAVRDLLQSCEQLVSQLAAGSADALNYPGVCMITASGVDAMTLAAPIAGDPHNGGDDGKSVIIYDTTGHAHTITAPANAIANSKHLLTLTAPRAQTLHCRPTTGSGIRWALRRASPSANFTKLLRLRLGRHTGGKNPWRQSMPIDEVVDTPAAQKEESEVVSLADYRKERTAPAEAAKKTETPSGAEEATTAAVSETAHPESEVQREKEAGKAAERGNLQKRFDELIRENRETREASERRIAELEARIAGKTQPEKPAAKAGDKPRPQEKDFKTYGEYVEALTDWKVEQARNADRAATAEEMQKAEEAEKNERTKQSFDAYNAAIAPAQAAHQDFKEVLGSPDLMLPNYIQVALIGKRDLGPELAYQLAKEYLAAPQDKRGEDTTLGRILALNEKGEFSDAMLELGGFVRSLSPQKRSPEPKPKPVSSAPEPIKPVGGGGAPADVDPDKVESVAEWRRQRKAGKIR